MTSLQLDRYEMHLRVLACLDEFGAQVTTIAAMAECRDQIEALMEQAIDQAGEADADITGTTEHKRDRRKVLHDACLAVSAGARSVAQAADDRELARWASVSPSRLKRFTDADFYIHAFKLNELCQPHLAALAAVGVGQTEIDALQTATQVFLESNYRPPKVQIHRRLQREAFVRTQHMIDELLRNKMDLFVNLFRTSNRNMVMRYRLARALRHRKGTPRQWVTGRQVPPGATVRTAPFRAAPASIVLFHNMGLAPLRFVLIDAGRPVSDPLTVGPGLRHSAPLSDLGPGGQMFEVRNMDPLLPGRFILNIG